MNNFDNNFEIYNVFKNILSGCKTMVDAFYFAEKIIKNNPDLHDFILGMIHNKKYDKSYDIRSMAHTLNQLNLLENRKEIDEFINNNIKNYVDIIQLNSFLRLSKTKQYELNENPENKKISVSFSKKVDVELITKKCPHCLIMNRFDKNLDYVICGYTDNAKGYDWNGCGKDWCNKCNKMLCKSWKKDLLFIPNNRKHDKICCKEYAKENMIDENLFCSCLSEDSKINN